MERAIGRQLDSKEHVHHINGDKLDNRLENLEILSHSEHSLRHARDRRLAYQKKFSQRWAWKYDKCAKCLSTEKKHKANGLCVNCHSVDLIKRNREKANEYQRAYRTRKKCESVS